METVSNLNSRGMGRHKQKHSVSRRAVVIYASVYTTTQKAWSKTQQSTKTEHMSLF